VRLITKDWLPRPKDDDLGVPWYIHHLRMAHEQGLGTLDASKINIAGVNIEDVRMNWEKSDDGVYPEMPER
jgi:hypothetical protein